MKNGSLKPFSTFKVYLDRIHNNPECRMAQIRMICTSQGHARFLLLLQDAPFQSLCFVHL